MENPGWVLQVKLRRYDGETWGSPVALEDGQTELSYPAVIQTIDGKVHMTYTWNRTHFRHLILDADALRRR